jgi:hypothetical protein
METQETINKKTRIELGLIITLFTSTIALAFWSGVLWNTQNTNSSRIDKLQVDVALLQSAAYANQDQVNSRLTRIETLLTQIHQTQKEQQ